ncbi:MAG: WbqC family protein [Luteibaculum sp.]
MEQNLAKDKVVLPTVYFGNLDWHVFALQSGETWIESQENFSKQTLRNRNRILGANGVLDLSIPIKKKNSKAGIQHMQMDNEAHWRWQHYHAYVSAYRNSPYFEFYQPDLEQLMLDESCENLWDFNLSCLKLVCRWMKLPFEFNFTSEFQLDYGVQDFRKAFKPSKQEQFFHFPPYLQVFVDRFSFVPNLSILDLVFNLGPESTKYLKNIAFKLPN